MSERQHRIAALAWLGALVASAGLVLLLAARGRADWPAAQTVISGHCRKLELCTGVQATGVCQLTQFSVTDEVSALMGGMVDVTLISTESDAAAYTCVAETAAADHDNAANSYQFLTGSLTASSPMVSFTAPIEYLWINCTAYTGPGSINVSALACSR